MAVLAVTLGVVPASGVVNVTGALQVMWMAWSLRRHIRWSYVVRLLPGILVGLGLGLFTLKSFDPTRLIQLLGFTIIAISAWNLLSRRGHGHGSPLWDFAVGFASGAIGGAFNTGGPPLVAYLYQRPDPPAVLVATVQGTFLVFTTVRFVGASAVGLIDAEVLQLAALFVPWVIAGAVSGLALGRRVSPERFRRISWIALGGLGAALALRA